MGGAQVIKESGHDVDIVEYLKTPLLEEEIEVIAGKLGLKPSQFKNFSWGPDNSVLLQGKKKPIKPMHPHWAIIFELKKQPRNIQGRLSTLCRSLERAIKNGKIDLNVDSLIAAHRNRKKCCYLRRKQTLAC